MIEVPTARDVTTQGGNSTASPFDAAELFQRYRDSVVNISTRIHGPNTIDQTIGTGFVVESDSGSNVCRIATDDHVRKAAGSNFIVQFPDGDKLLADFELSDKKNDLAILRVGNMPDLAKSCKPLVVSDSDRPFEERQPLLKLSARMGEPEYTVGTFEEYFQRSQAEALPLLEGEDPKRTMMSIKSAGNGGDSGGPLINGLGIVVGIDDASGPGIIAATPAGYLSRDLRSGALMART